MIHQIAHTFLFIILYSATIYSQDWFWQNPLPRGNAIATLVNDEKPAGNYEVKFNGYYLTSGIYFYQLRAGNYVETKKMVFLK